VIKFTAPSGDNKPVPVQQRVGGTDDNNAPNAVSGQSFWSSDGTTWTDFASYGVTNSYVANIHAFESSTAPITPASSPAVSTQNANSLDLFVQGTDHALWHESLQGSAWSAWVSLGGFLTSSPAATSPANGVIDVFVRGSDGALYSKQLSGGAWGSWKKIGGQLAPGTGPAADAQNANSLDVFVQGTDHVLYYTHWDGTAWSAWHSLGGVLTSSPAATSPANGVIDVFVRGSDYTLWERTFNGGWSGWMSIGGL
jgi:hypothetical protein